MAQAVLRTVLSTVELDYQARYKVAVAVPSPDLVRLAAGATPCSHDHNIQPPPAPHILAEVMHKAGAR
jgi:hypothetical protein